MSPRRNRTFWESLSKAWAGLLWAVRAERNVPLLLVGAILALALALVLGLSGPELALLILVIAVVLAAELFNTALERLLDLLHSEYHPQVRQIKDLAAGAVLLTALGSLAVGLLLFASRLIGKSGEIWLGRLLATVLLLLLAALLGLGRRRKG